MYNKISANEGAFESGGVLDAGPVILVKPRTVAEYEVKQNYYLAQVAPQTVDELPTTAENVRSSPAWANAHFVPSFF